MTACVGTHPACRRVVEIGVWHGVTTCRLRKVMAADGILYAVDPYPAGRIGISLQRQDRPLRSRPGVQRPRGVGPGDRGRRGPWAGGKTGRSRVEFVFIDGDHGCDGLRADWEGWSVLVAPGGSIALHDSRSSPVRPLDNAGERSLHQ